ncbi:DNA primase [Candidatus Acetothermia bacterium]|nr:MAG: DNA primase [Candidatus Acetothermia bacterium]
MPRPEVEEVKARVNIVELIGRYVTLKPSGKNYKGRCPFHPDDTPSLMVSPEKGLWHCFGCGAGGDAIAFLMRIERLSFPEALARLAQEVGVELRGGGAKTELYRACQAVAQFFFRELRSPQGRRARDYLLSRGIGEGEWERWGLGYAPDSWDALLKGLSRLGVETLKDLGLVVEGERGYYDRFRNRVMFTLRDDQGRPIAFAGRALGEAQPKYLNVPNTPLFTKGTILYGLDLAKQAIRKRGMAILVEGYTDVISLHAVGFPEAVGSMGTALTEAQARLLARYTDRVVIAYDRDAAGSAASLRGMVILREAGLRVEVAQLPEGEDPDSLARGGGQKVVAAVLEGAKPFHRFFLDSLAERYDLSALDEKEAALAEARQLWPKVRSLPLRAELARGLAELLSLPEEEVRTALQRKRRFVREEPAAREPTSEELVLHFLINGKLPDEVILDLEASAFRPEYRPIVEKWLEFWRAGETPTPHNLAAELDEEAQGHLARLALLDVRFSDEERAILDALTKFLYLPRLERKLSSLAEEMARLEGSGSPKLRQLEAEYQQLARERLALLRRRA